MAQRIWRLTAGRVSQPESRKKKVDLLWTGYTGELVGMDELIDRGDVDWEDLALRWSLFDGV